MKIRSRLLLIYAVMVVALLLAGTFCIWAMLGWSRAASKLSGMTAQSLRAERLRATVYRQANYASDYLRGDNEARPEFWSAQESAAELLDALKFNAIAQEEKEHIRGLEETQFELVWTMNKFFEREEGQIAERNLPRSLDALREIADEVADDVASLNQYYRSQENRALAGATNAGSFATLAVIITGVIALLQFVLLVFLLQRWLVRPITTVNQAAKAVSDGNLDIRVSLSGKDEWGELARAINQMVQSLKTSQRRLRNQERLAALGEVAAYAAHHIRNPLASIRAAGQVMLNERTAQDIESAELLTEIMKTVDRLDAWLKRLLEFTKPLELELRQTDINQLVRQAVSLAHRSFGQSGIQLEWQLTENLPSVEVDPILLEQSLVAIATNAFQAVSEARPPGRSKVKVQTTYGRAENDVSWLTIRISDNGKGVPDHIRPELFRIFVSSKDGGTGLGLAHAKKIVDIHGGEINLESSLGEGTTITVRLPSPGRENEQAL